VARSGNTRPDSRVCYLAPRGALSHDLGIEITSLEPLPAIGRRGRVLAVDDDAPFLALLRDVVRATGALEAVGEADSGELAVEAARELAPDVVLMDVRMPGLGGIAAARRIKASRPSTFVVLISTAHPDELAFEGDDTVADAVIWKSELGPQLLDQIWLRYRDLGCV
jgi:DNA-binding NarL/FixJ family response regulator